ncbi:hypothetical protein CBR_g30400 [Chara braunii]|uniref:Protein kinase domain-containing protein n=1 Tax=Chara braunii TaxID=69332 RepID=A0A388LCJ5_CHABU|nr:hypothetical protein CBR_g30400 [Chara braunii]|eukprot:GBG80031.1 hypothetical protein CBR_g30400 [Chara braunii]
MPNGTLSQHLHNPANYGYKPLRWNERVQIALDAARALEYIHEHTTPRYVHRDIKSNNILLDKNMRAKVADFGLTKLIRENSDGNSQTRLVGTFGYMAPEYARFGEISTKVDVYAFGVVLLELVSGKEAIVQRDATGMNGTIISLVRNYGTSETTIDVLVPYGLSSIVTICSNHASLIHLSEENKWD